MSITEERLTELKDGSTEIIQSEKQKDNSEKNTWNLRGMMNSYRRSHNHVIKVPEREEKEWAHKLTNKFRKLSKLQTGQPQRNPDRHIVIKFSETKHAEGNLARALPIQEHGLE